MIHKQLSLIKSYIPDCPDFSKPLNQENIMLIITAYAKLKFQEHSLSIKFQNLTTEQLQKQHTCDTIREELLCLKQSDSYSTHSSRFQRLSYNEIKSTMDIHRVSAHSEEFEESQRLLIKLYLQVVNLGSIVCRAVHAINHNSVFHQHDNAFLQASNVIRSSQLGFSGRGEREIKKTITFREGKKTFKTEIDNIEEIMSFSVSLAEIEDTLARFIKNSKNLHEIAKMIKSDCITCFFVDIHRLDSRLSTLAAQPKALILDLNIIGTSVFKEKYNNVSMSTKEILIRIRDLLAESQKEMIKFYERSSPDILEKLEKALNMDLSSRNSVTYPSEILECKPKGMKRLSEESSIKYKVLDSARNNTDEQLTKGKQEIPSRAETFTKCSTLEIMGELKSLRSKVSELKCLERKVNSETHKDFMLKNPRKFMLKGSVSSSKSSSRPLTVSNYMQSREKRSNYLF